MKTLEEFKEFYDTKLHSTIEDVNKMQSEAKRKIIFRYLLLIIPFAFLLGIILIASNDENVESTTNLVILTVLFIAGVTSIILIFQQIFKTKAKFIISFKEKLTTRLVKFINEDFEYYPEDYISMNDFQHSGIFRQSIDRYGGDDFVKGKIDKTQFWFSEIHAARKEVTHDDDGQKERWVNVFDGLFFKCDFNKDFKGKTFVLPDKTEKFLGRFAKKIQSVSKQYGQLIHLEDPEFEKLYKVYSSDQVEARYILSTSLMKRITDFKNNMKEEIYISFVNSLMYVAISSKKQFFEPRIWRNTTSYEKLSEYLSDLLIVVNIVEDLNLNTRIWSKQ